MELGPHGITVNAVAPGFVRTDMTQGGRGAADWQGTEERLGARAMMGRIGEPEDIANAVVFLVSPESGWIYGTDADRGWRSDGLHRTRLASSPEQVAIGAAWLIIGLTFSRRRSPQRRKRSPSWLHGLRFRNQHQPTAIAVDR
jgi:Enoyl-(Acyl carrier protein) reductase